MFLVTAADAAAIRATFEQSGELAAAVELRRPFQGITDNEQGRACVRSISLLIDPCYRPRLTQAYYCDRNLF